MGRRHKAKKKDAEYTPPGATERILYLSLGAILIIGSLYLGLRNNKISEEDLSPVRVTLAAEPEIHIYTFKLNTYREIILRTREHKRQFMIMGHTYDATDLDGIRADIRSGDLVELKLKTKDVDDIDQETFNNNYNEVYNIIKDKTSYVNLNKLENISDDDSKWAFVFTAVGLIYLPYGIMKKKPMISVDNVLGITAAIFLIVLFLIYS